jgi:hypothetical protein
MQPSLFDVAEVGDLPPPDCQFPNYSGHSGYTMGCRCRRCSAAHHTKPSPFCSVEGCGGRRVKGRRYCVDHAPVAPAPPRCRAPGCDQLKRPGRGAHFCEEHSASPPERSRTIERPCWLCEKPVRIDGTAARAHERAGRRALALCEEHQCFRRLALQGLRHQASTEKIIGWMREPMCDFCHEPLAFRSAGLSTGGEAPVVDHDHNCCPGRRSCGECIRGLVHGRCNILIGHAQAAVDRAGSIEAVMKYLT